MFCCCLVVWVGGMWGGEGGDLGSMERESALLSLLVQMDGIHGALEQVR